jgi:nitrate reductase gamma subunit
MYFLLAAVIVFGVLATIVHSATGQYDYREGVSVWFRDFWTFRPDPVLMSQAPIFFQLHVLSALLIFAVWPFTRLVHVFAMPLGYLTRPYIVYRSRDDQRAKERRGWEKIDF